MDRLAHYLHLARTNWFLLVVGVLACATIVAFTLNDGQRDVRHRGTISALNRVSTKWTGVQPYATILLNDGRTIKLPLLVELGCHIGSDVIVLEQHVWIGEQLKVAGQCT